MKNNPRLKYLDLSETNVTDAAVRSLIELASLQELDLSRTEITDAAAPLLAKMSQLKTLRLNSTKVKDAGALQLSGLRNLQILDLSTYFSGKPPISADAIATLRTRLPRCRVLAPTTGNPFHSPASKNNPFNKQPANKRDPRSNPFGN